MWPPSPYTTPLGDNISKPLHSGPLQTGKRRLLPNPGARALVSVRLAPAAEVYFSPATPKKPRQVPEGEWCFREVEKWLVKIVHACPGQQTQGHRVTIFKITPTPTSFAHAEVCAECAPVSLGRSRRLNCSPV